MPLSWQERSRASGLGRPGRGCFSRCTPGLPAQEHTVGSTPWGARPRSMPREHTLGARCGEHAPGAHLGEHTLGSTSWEHAPGARRGEHAPGAHRGEHVPGACPGSTPWEHTLGSTSQEHTPGARPSPLCSPTALPRARDVSGR